MRNSNKIQVKINNDSDYKISDIINNLFLLGFCSTSTEFPVASTKSGIDINDEVFKNSRDKVFELCKKSTKNIEKYKSSSSSAEYISDMHVNRKFGLEKLFDIGPFLEDENFDLLADKMKFKFQLPLAWDKHIIASMGNLAFRFGMSTSKFEGELFANQDYTGNLVIFSNKENPSIELINENDRYVIKISGYGEQLEDFVTEICRSLPDVNYNYSFSDYIEDMIEAFKLKSFDGQKAYASYLTNNKSKKVIAGIDLNNKEKINNDDLIEYVNYKREELVCCKNFDIEWEIDVFKRDFLKFLETNTCDKIFVDAALSEDKKIRRDLLVWMKKEAKKKRLDIRVQLVCAYKSGFSWLEEIIIPKLRKNKLSRIDIDYTPCIADDNVEYSNEEASALPSYHNYGTGEQASWYDMPIRFLQELYPIDDVIEKELNLDKSKVNFIKTNREDNYTYVVRAYDENNEEILCEKYKVETYEIPYISKFEHMGYVHPSTGYLKIYDDYDKTQLYNSQIKTDVDNIWKILQTDVLDYIEIYMHTVCEKGIENFSTPVFSRLEFDIEVSEPDYRIGCREDLISSLDGLHEDIYFVMSDYFQNYGMVNFEHPFDSPGLILPKIKNVFAKPSFKLKMYKNTYNKPFFKVDNEKIDYSIISKSKPEIYVDKIGYMNGKLIYNLDFHNIEGDFFSKYLDLLASDELSISEKFNFNAYIKSEKVNSKMIEFNKISKKDLSFEENMNILDSIDFREGQVIGYEQNLEIMAKLSKLSNIQVYQVGESYQGRKIHAIDFLSEEEKGVVSRLKQITFNPSQLINCRHHANEVSSTNAAYKLIYDLLSKKENKKIIDNINLTLLPLENVDGANLHYELQKENPNWKLHVSRFNSLGREFFYDTFDRDTIHIEAKAMRRIYEKWLPDLIVDNHGVPSHEWEQQFSGYTSPSFKGFWLPRSILYGYFWPVKEDKFSDNKLLCYKIQDEVSLAINREKELRQLNLEWAERFEKYAHKWMPNMFPANYYNDMIFYWIEREHAQTQKYVSHKYPWITTAFFTSEVADETAQGEYLKLCTHAHFIHNMAILKTMAETKSIYDSSCKKSELNMLINLTRLRPIIV